MSRDSGIDTLLDLNGHVIDQGSGYWLKIEAWRVDPVPEIPHGVRYALTLHNPQGERILGYDNAHSVRLRQKFKYVGQVPTYDHKHRHAGDKGLPYECQDAYQLLKDFFADVDRTLQELQQR